MVGTSNLGSWNGHCFFLCKKNNEYPVINLSEFCYHWISLDISDMMNIFMNSVISSDNLLRISNQNDL